MLLKRQVKAGILLYALLMMAIFSLLLSFYLHRQSASILTVKAYKQSTTAYTMAHFTAAEVTKQKSPKKSGQVDFQEGQVTYQRQKSILLVTVALTSGSSYQYRFPISSENS